MFRRVIVWLLAVFVVGQTALLWAPVTTRAAGSAIFEHTGPVLEIVRTSEKDMFIKGRVKVTEDGFRNETFAYFTMTQKLTFKSSDADYDYWTIASISLIDLGHDGAYGKTNSKLVGTTGAEFYNRTNELVAKVDYSKLPTDSPISRQVPCYQVYRGGGDPEIIATKGQIMAAKFEGGTCLNTFKSGKYPANDQTPLSGVAFYVLPRPDDPTPIATNYDLKDKEIEDTKYSKTVVAGWFNNKDIPGLKITIFEEKGQPPKVFVPKKTLEELGGNPPGDLVFKLVSHSGEGAANANNRDWITFEGYLGEELIKNLYLSVNDNVSGTNDAVFYFSSRYDELKKGQYDTSEQIARVASSEDSDFAKSVGDYFTYTMNVPLNSDDSVGGDNCGQGFVGDDKKIAITGPKDKNKDVIPLPNNNRTTDIGVNGEDARELNQNCVNIRSNGWLVYWNVRDLFSSTPGESSDGCGVSNIFTAGDIGKVFSVLVDCLFKAIFEPIVNWATNLVIQAAGITYYRPEYGDRWRA